MSAPTYETGAKDESTNEFILCAINTYETYQIIAHGLHAAQVFNAGRNSVFKHIEPTAVDFHFAQEYFDRVREEASR